MHYRASVLESLWKGIASLGTWSWLWIETRHTFNYQRKIFSVFFFSSSSCLQLFKPSVGFSMSQNMLGRKAGFGDCSKMIFQLFMFSLHTQYLVFLYVYLIKH